MDDPIADLFLKAPFPLQPVSDLFSASARSMQNVPVCRADVFRSLHHSVQDQNFMHVSDIALRNLLGYCIFSSTF